MKQRKHHILFLPAWYPHRYDTMEGLFVQNHAKAVAPFHRISVLHAVAIDTTNPFPVVEVEKANGFPEITVYYQKVSSHIPFISQYQKLRRWREALKKGVNYLVMHYGQPDFIHVHILTRYAVAAWFLSKKWNISYGITEHWSRYLASRRKKDYRGFIRHLLTRFVVHRANFVLPVTENLQNAMQEVGLSNNHYKVVPNVADTELFTPSSTDIPLSPFSFVHISCMDNKAKNVTGLLDCIQLLHQENKDFKLTIIGDGPDMNLIKAHCKTLNLDDIVRFTGTLTGQTLVEEFQQHHCLVMFSNYENMPVVINESFACGLPVIATRVGGIPEVVSRERGILTEPNNIHELKEAMLSMMKHYAEYDKTALRQYAIEHFSYPVVGNTLSDLYSKNI